MIIIPSELLAQAENDPQILLKWLGAEEMKDIARNNSGHLLVKLDKYLELEEVLAKLVGYHHIQGPGSSVVHSVRKLLRAVVVGGLYDLSLRELEQFLRYNLVARWYVGYERFEEVADHVTLGRFMTYLINHHERILFDGVLKKIDAMFGVEQAQIQIGDTYAMIANAAQEGLVKRLRHGAEFLLRAYTHAGLLDEQPWLHGYDWSALLGKSEETQEAFLDKAKRKEREQNTVLAAYDLLERIEGGLKNYPSKAYPTVRLWVERMRKIINDEYRIELVTAEPSATPAAQTNASAAEPAANPSQTEPPAADVEAATASPAPTEPPASVPATSGAPTLKITELKGDEKGTFRMGSASDPEATIRMHGEEEKDITQGYNNQVAIDLTGFVRETRAYPRPERGGRPGRGPNRAHANLPFETALRLRRGLGQRARRGRRSQQGQNQSCGQTPQLWEKQPALWPLRLQPLRRRTHPHLPAGQIYVRGLYLFWSRWPRISLLCLSVLGGGCPQVYEGSRPFEALPPLGKVPG